MQASRAVAVDFNLYNPHTAQYTIARFTFEFGPFGILSNHAEFWSLKMSVTMQHAAYDIRHTTSPARANLPILVRSPGPPARRQMSTLSTSECA